MPTITQEVRMSGETFRMERLRHRLSQYQVSRMSGVHPGRISRYENGTYDPLPSEQQALHGVIDKAVSMGSPYTKQEEK